jgi:hypothetical protein
MDIYLKNTKAISGYIEERKMVNLYLVCVAGQKGR